MLAAFLRYFLPSQRSFIFIGLTYSITIHKHLHGALHQIKPRFLVPIDLNVLKESDYEPVIETVMIKVFKIVNLPNKWGFLITELLCNIATNFIEKLTTNHTFFGFIYFNPNEGNVWKPCKVRGEGGHSARKWL